METGESIQKQISRSTANYVPTKIDYPNPLDNTEPLSQETHYVPDKVDYPKEENTNPAPSFEVPELIAEELLETTIEVSLDPFAGIRRLPSGSVELKKDKLLGKGAFGQVYLGQWNKQRVALKEINTKRAQQVLGLNEEEVLEALQWEVTRLAAVSHPNLVQFYGLYIEEDEAKNKKTYLVIEYCEKGDLTSVLAKTNPDWSKCLQWAMEITQGLAYLHHQGMLHRDLKAENILIDSHGRAKLADLGVAQVDALLQKEEAKVVFKGFQDRVFAAPEALQNVHTSTLETDIYALGIVFWQLLSQGKKPATPRYSDNSINVNKLLEQMQTGKREIIPEGCPQGFKELILSCWAFEPSKRPKIKGILRCLDQLLLSSHVEAHWMVLCQQIDVLIHSKRKEVLNYIPSLVTEHPVQEDLDVYWGRIEQTKIENLKAKSPDSKDFETANSLDQFDVNKQRQLQAETEDSEEESGSLTETAARKIKNFGKEEDTNSGDTEEEDDDEPDNDYEQHLESLRNKKGNSEENNNAKKSSLGKTGNPSLELQSIFTEFLSNPQPSTLLLLGESGLGKTLSTYQLADKLLSQWWQTLSSPKKEATPYFPLFIRPLLPRWSYSQLKNGFEKALQSFVLQAPLSSLKEARLLVIIDGYDECQADEVPINLAKQLGIKDLPHVKLLVTCRPSTVEATRLSERFALNGQLTTRYFLPFNMNQLLDYLNQRLHWNKKIHQEYQQKFQESHSLRVILRNPFVASLFVQSWETVKQKNFNQLNRWQIFGSFIEHWISTYCSLLSPKIQRDLTTHCKSKTRLERLVESFNNFASEIAFNAFQQGEISFDKKAKYSVTPLSKITLLWLDLKYYISQDSQQSFKKRQAQLAEKEQRRVLLSEQDYVAIMQWRLQQFEKDSPLKNKELLCEFSHKNFFEYFVAKRIVLLREKDHTSIVTEALGLLDYRLIQSEPEAIVFLAEGWQENKTWSLTEPLFEILEHSKKEEFNQLKASANAATILNVGRISFSEKDLKGVRIPYADLSYAILDHTNLQNADLSGARLQNAWLRGASLKGANLTSIQFSEKPYLSHDDTVCSVAYSPDGLWIATGSYHKITLWDANSGERRWVLEGHTSYVHSVAFSADAKIIVSGDEDNTIKLWDMKSHQERLSLKDQTNSVHSVALSLDGRICVSGGNNTVKIWELNSGKELRSLKGHASCVRSVALSADGKTIVSGGEDKIVKIWDLKTGKELRSLKGHADYVTSVALSLDGRICVSASNDKIIKIWEVETGKELRTLNNIYNADDGSRYSYREEDEGTINIVLSPDGKTCVSCEGKIIKIWELESGKELRTLKGHLYGVNSVALSPDGKTCASGSKDGIVKLWDLESSNELHILGHTDEVNSVAISLESKICASSDVNNRIVIWGLESGKVLRTLENAGSDVTLSKDGKICATISNNNTVKIWDVGTGKEIQTLKGHADYVMSVAISPDGKTVISGSKDKTVKIWDVETGKEISTLKGHPHEVDSVAFIKDNKTIISGSTQYASNTIKVWDKESGKELRALECARGYINAFSPDGKIWLLAGTRDSIVRIIDIETDEILYELEGHTEEVTSVAFSSDSKYCASGSEDYTVKIWNVETGKELHTLKGYLGWVSSISWQGDMLVTGSTDRSVKCWKIQPQSDNHFSVILLWSSEVSFYAEDCQLGQALLSPLNIRLLKQKGAIGYPLISISDHPDWNALHLAVANNQLEEIRHCVAQAQTLFLDSQTKEGETPLHIAVRYEATIEIIEYLMNQGANTLLHNLQGRCPGNLAADLGQKELLAYLPCEDKEHAENTPLHLAIENGYGRVVDYLLKQRKLNKFECDINALNHQNQTPLLLAVAKNNSQIIELLLKHGAEPNQKNKNGETALHITVSHWRTCEDDSADIKILTSLKKYGANLLAKDNQGDTPLHRAATNNQVEAITWLIAQGVPVDITRDDGCTPLHQAAYAGANSAVELLLKREANAKAINKNKETPAQLARKNKKEEIAKLIERYVKYGSQQTEIGIHYLKLAQIAISENDLKKAIDYYEKVIDINPQFQPVQHNLGCCYFAQAILEKNNSIFFKKAEQSFYAALSLDGHSGICTEYANFLFFLQRYEEAIVLLLGAIKLKDDDKGLSYGQLEKNSIPEELKEEVNAQGSISFKAVIFAYYLLILVYQKTNQFTEAMALLPSFYKEITQRPETEPLDYVLLGYSYKALGLFKEAALCFDKAYQLKSEYISAKRNRDECLRLAENLIKTKSLEETMKNEVVQEKSTYNNAEKVQSTFEKAEKVVNLSTVYQSSKFNALTEDTQKTSTPMIERVNKSSLRKKPNEKLILLETELETLSLKSQSTDNNVPALVFSTLKKPEQSEFKEDIELQTTLKTRKKEKKRCCHVM